MRILLFAILLQATFLRMSAASPTPAEFAFEHRNGLLWVRVNVADSPEPFNFLLDSGAAVSVIDVRIAKQLGAKLGQRVSVRGVGSSTTGFWPQRLSVSAGRVELPREYLAVDLNELSQASGRGVDGLIGADFFQDRIVQIDFNEEKVRLLSASTESTNTSVVRLKKSRGALLASARVNGKKAQWLRVDTGCAAALHWVAGRTLKTDATPTVSVGLTAISVPTDLTKVQLGTATFDSVSTGLHQRPIFSGEAGLLGNRLLACFDSVTFDVRKGRLLLEGRRTNLH